MTIEEAKPFLAWFTANDGWIDTNAIDIVALPKEDGSRGVVAITDIPEGHTIFSVPRTLVLSSRTSTLRARFGVPVWNAHRLHKGWSGLILTMMWEAAQGQQSKWGPFFDVMPKTFETPMFWNEEDLAELQGTSVIDKLGREDAEKDYNEKVLPAIKSRPDLFNPADIDTRYSLENYHIQGSRVLSRSFTLENEDTVEGEEADEHEHGSEGAHGHDHGHDHDHAHCKGHDHDHEPTENTAANTSVGSAMDVDGTGAGEEDGEEGSNSDSDDQEDAEPGIVVMVPLADMLNARYQSENVKLFYEPTTLKMITTQPIPAGSQIFNTYEDLPNSELLRGFGHVDYLPLPGDHCKGEYGCPGDVAELRADVLVEALGGEVDEKDLEGRIEWWLEEGGDDAFTLEFPENGDPTSIELAPDLLAFLLLIGVDAEWERSKEKGKLPKPRPTPTTMRILLEALKRRTEVYPTSMEEDKKLAENMHDMGMNKRHALVVRMGEKRVLSMYKTRVGALLSTLEAEEKSTNTEVGKRKAGKDDEGGRKKRRG